MASCLDLNPESIVEYIRVMVACFAVINSEAARWGCIQGTHGVRACSSELRYYKQKKDVQYNLGSEPVSCSHHSLCQRLHFDCKSTGSMAIGK